MGTEIWFQRMDGQTSGRKDAQKLQKLCPSLLGITNSMPRTCNSSTVVSFKIIFLISGFDSQIHLYLYITTTLRIFYSKGHFDAVYNIISDHIWTSPYLASVQEHEVGGI